MLTQSDRRSIYFLIICKYDFSMDIDEDKFVLDFSLSYSIHKLKHVQMCQRWIFSR